MVLSAVKHLTCVAVLQREKRETSFDCPFPICHLLKVCSQECSFSCLFVFGSFVLVLHSYSKHKRCKTHCEALFFFLSVSEVLLGPFVPNWQAARSLNFP